MSEFKERVSRYRILKVLGKGAFGVVYLAEDPKLERLVALKTINIKEGLTEQEEKEQREKIIKEAQALAKMVHPNIVTIYDVFEAEGQTYISMEYLDGIPLDKYVESRGKLSLEEIIDIVIQTLTALSYAHSLNIIHRDLKPSNIMIVKNRIVKITDFGLAKKSNTPTSTEGFLIGTPHYMSPEQIDGLPLDGRCDLFAVGVILYELLSGSRPFEGDTISQILKKILFEKPKPLLEISKDIPKELSEIVEKALSKNPKDRFKNAEEFIEALKRVDPTIIKNHHITFLPPPPPPKGTKFSIDWKTVLISGISGGIFTLLILFLFENYISSEFNFLNLFKDDKGSKLPKAIEVLSDPSNATLFLDGKKVQVPIIKPHDRKKHKLLAKKGCLSAETFISYETESPVRLKLRERPFEVFIDSDPQGAEIFINNEETGFRTPASIPRINCEDFEIILKLDGFRELKYTFSPRESDSILLTLTPETPEGKIIFESDREMKFFLDTKLIGKSGDVVTLKEGEYILRVVDENVLGEKEIKVNVSANETKRIHIEPFKTIKIFLIGRPEEDGEVFIDGRKVGELPITGDMEIAIQKHTVTVVSPKGKKVKFEWDVKNGNERKIVDFETGKVFSN